MMAARATPQYWGGLAAPFGCPAAGRFAIWPDACDCVGDFALLDGPPLIAGVAMKLVAWGQVE